MTGRTTGKTQSRTTRASFFSTTGAKTKTTRRTRSRPRARRKKAIRTKRRPNHGYRKRGDDSAYEQEKAQWEEKEEYVAFTVVRPSRKKPHESQTKKWKLGKIIRRENNVAIYMHIGK